MFCSIETTELYPMNLILDCKLIQVTTFQG
ncbi:hypothetical protein L8106_21579 [Lyngbya sp. PCC 8106]|nr:hypothetical protein L8106_21579 [Lyngbya sp. PCC 8106]